LEKKRESLIKRGKKNELKNWAQQQPDLLEPKNCSPFFVRLPSPPFPPSHVGQRPLCMRSKFAAHFTSNPAPAKVRFLSLSFFNLIRMWLARDIQPFCLLLSVLCSPEMAKHGYFMLLLRLLFQPFLSLSLPSIDSSSPS